MWCSGYSVIVLFIFTTVSSMATMELQEQVKRLKEEISEIRDKMVGTTQLNKLSSTFEKRVESVKNSAECATKKRFFEFIYFIIPYYLKKNSRALDFFKKLENELALCSNDSGKNNVKIPDVEEEPIIAEVEQRTKMQIESYVNATAANLNRTWIQLMQDINRTVDEGKAEIMEINEEMYNIEDTLQQQRVEKIAMKFELKTLSTSLKRVLKDVQDLKEFPNVVRTNFSDQFNRTKEAIKTVSGILNETETIKNTLEELKEKTHGVLQENINIKLEVEGMQKTIKEQKTNQSSAMKTMKEKLENMYDLLDSARSDVNHLQTLDKDLKANLSNQYNKSKEHQLLLKIIQEEVNSMNKDLGNKIIVLQEEIKSVQKSVRTRNTSDENSSKTRAKSFNNDTDSDSSSRVENSTVPDSSSSIENSTDPDSSSSVENSTDPDSSSSVEISTVPDSSSSVENSIVPDSSSSVEISTLPYSSSTSTSTASSLVEASCPNFVVKDPEVIMTIKERDESPNDMPLANKTHRPSNEERLFRCSHIGQFQLRGERKIRCENGEWTGSQPICAKLLDENYILDYLKGKYPCPTANDQFPHPTDCTKFYNCGSIREGYETVCPQSLFFDFPSRQCQYPALTNCRESRLIASQFKDSPPAIDYNIKDAQIEVADAAYVNEEGSLVVYPETTIIFSCLFPRNHGDVEWKVPSQNVPVSYKKWLSSSDTKIEMKLNLAVKISKKKDSGNYTCMVLSTGQSHTINVVVPGCQRPDLSQHEALLLNPNQEEYAIDEVVRFSCKENFSLVGALRMTCRRNGSWSLPPSRMPMCD